MLSEGFGLLLGKSSPIVFAGFCRPVVLIAPHSTTSTLSTVRVDSGMLIHTLIPYDPLVLVRLQNEVEKVGEKGAVGELRQAGQVDEAGETDAVLVQALVPLVMVKVQLMQVLLVLAQVLVLMLVLREAAVIMVIVQMLLLFEQSWTLQVALVLVLVVEALVLMLAERVV